VLGFEERISCCRRGVGILTMPMHLDRQAVRSDWRWRKAVVAWAGEQASNVCDMPGAAFVDGRELDWRQQEGGRGEGGRFKGEGRREKRQGEGKQKESEGAIELQQGTRLRKEYEGGEKARWKGARDGKGWSRWEAEGGERREDEGQVGGE